MMNYKDKIRSLPEASKQVQAWKEAGLKVVFTNGCFDLMHAGHVDYLEKARNLGDRLVVGLNTDTSVQRLKGPSRPVCNDFSRSSVLAALQSVDLVVFFDEETPFNLIRTLSPDILTKGQDYSIENIVGADFVMQNGGMVETIPFVEGYSTSAIVKKILNT